MRKVSARVWGYTALRFGQISSVHVPGLDTAPSDGSVNLLVVGSDSRQGCVRAGSERPPGSAAT